MRKIDRIEMIGRLDRHTHKLLSIVTAVFLFFGTTFSIFAQTTFEGNLNSVSITDAAGTNSPPTASFTYSQNGAVFTFDASGSSDPDGTISKYRWDFGDGATSAEVATSHDYVEVGEYNVTLTAIDNLGAVALSQIHISTTSTVSCITPLVGMECNSAAVPDAFFAKNLDRTTVREWISNTSGSINRIKVYFGEVSNGTWDNFDAIKVVVYFGKTIVGTASITPQNNSWVWSEPILSESGQKVSFEINTQISFGLSIDTPSINAPTYAFGYFNDNTPKSFLYAQEFLPSNISWGGYPDRTLAAVLEIDPQ